MMWPWTFDVAEYIEALNNRCAALETKIIDLESKLEAMRLAQYGAGASKDRPMDATLDSNWHLRRRELERKFAKEKPDAK